VGILDHESIFTPKINPLTTDDEVLVIQLWLHVISGRNPFWR